MCGSGLNLRSNRLNSVLDFTTHWLWPSRPRQRDDHGHLTANQIGRQCRQPVELALRPAAFDCKVLALDIAGFAQALVKRAETARRQVLLMRFGAEKPDHRHRQCWTLQRIGCGRRDPASETVTAT